MSGPTAAGVSARSFVRRASRRTAGIDRVVGLDVARCLALVGMMTAHILPKVVAGRVSWQQRLVTGNAAALFAVLAGVTLALLSGRRAPVRGRAWARAGVALTVRAVLIVVIGLVLGQLGDQGIGVILPYYGVLFLLGVAFLRFGSRSLFVLSGVAMIVIPVLSQLVRAGVPNYGVNGFSELSPPQLVLALTLTGDYPAVPWLAYLLCGMAIGRLDLRDQYLSWRLCGAGVALIAAASAMSGILTSSAAVHTRLIDTWNQGPVDSWHSLTIHLAAGLEGTTPTGSWWWLAVAAPHSGTTFDLARTVGVSLLVIGLALFATQWASHVWHIAAGAGTMTLSLYSLHLIMLNPRTWPDVGEPRFIPEVTIVLVVGAAFAALGLRGPLETLVSGLSRRTARRLVTMPPTTTVLPERARSDLKHPT